MRALFLSLREQDFVQAARAVGVSDTRITFRHILPNALGPIIVSATLLVASAIVTEAFVSFLNFGLKAPGHQLGQRAVELAAVPDRSATGGGRSSRAWRSP